MSVVPLRRFSFNRCSVAICLALSMPLTVHAQAATEKSASQSEAYSFDIPAQGLGDALQVFARVSRQQVSFDGVALEGKTSSALSGTYAIEEALRILLEGTGVKYRRGARGVWLVGPSRSTKGGNPASSNSGENGEPAQTMDTMVVTGTRIRGGSTPSPVITIGSKQIQEEGFTDLGEVIRSVPQNFNGGQNPGVVGAAINVTNQDITGGSGLNLRGLGPDATLTLLNGRRMSYGGSFQAVDISAIPVEAVERIEIVADGASAIYGSDAVGGVGNVILKRDFEGVTVGARYGAATDGGLSTREYTATAGAVWSNGGLIATYKDVSADPIYADQRSYTEKMYDPYTIYPGSDVRSGLLSAHQSFGEMVDLRLDALKTEREQTMYIGTQAYYQVSKPQITTSLVSPSVEFFLAGDWTLSAGGTWGKDELQNDVLRIAIPTGTSTLVKRGCDCNESRTYEFSAEGPLFALGGGDARLAVGVGYRTNDLHFLSTISTNDGDESSRFAYAEINLPLISPDSSTPGAHRLALTAAVRGEDYSTFGKVTTPKLGLVYGPSADYTFKASWGKSFKAPTLYQRYLSSIVFLDPANWYGASTDDTNVLYVTGGNSAVDPERARTWTTSIAFHPEAIPNLEAELTWFNIDYTDRVVQPINTSSVDILNNPSNAPFVIHSPTAEQQADILAAADINLTDPGYDTSSVVAIILDHFTNAAVQHVRGIDLSGSYGFDLGGSRLAVRGSASWLDSSQQTTADQSSFDLAGTRANPAKFNSRMGAVWSVDGITASLFSNYTSGITVSDATAGAAERTASFTTFDATLRYDASARGGAWSGLEFLLSMQNMLDRAPPLYSTALDTAIRYDSTNYSAIGRYMSVSISKHW